ncbi:hypothetical protein TNIN_273271 [Trichonephila inaurata madagascariensis]|uniref:Uncharacterized protein n=1 Tax=Trichonephila inaurata madagascariensis TaxID=2747483 RepID=A0A8X6MFC7_9ARAC|nr:hypothetical protein TNIN_273271 [Trichonephila inaurata madagascariensis]
MDIYITHLPQRARPSVYTKRVQNDNAVHRYASQLSIRNTRCVGTTRGAGDKHLPNCCFFEECLEKPFPETDISSREKELSL